jgi:hypothetical protein
MSNFVGFTIDQPRSSPGSSSLKLAAYTAGGGSLNLNPPGPFYASNTVVTVIATPAPGWTFLGWLGDTDSSNQTIQVTLTSDKALQALFGTQLATMTAGGGSILRNPNSAHSQSCSQRLFAGDKSNANRVA